MKKSALLISTLLALALPLQAHAAKGGEKGPSDSAWENANENARFKREGEKLKKEKHDKKDKYDKKEKHSHDGEDDHDHDRHDAAMTTTGAIGTQIGIADVIGIGTTPTGMVDVTGIGTTPTGMVDVTGNMIWNASVNVICGTKRTGFVTASVDPASAGPGSGAKTPLNNQLEVHAHTGKPGG